MATKTTQTVTHPDGTISTRTSARTYTHAVEIRDPDGSFGLIGWRSNAKSAESEANKWRRCQAVREGSLKGATFRVVEVD